MKVIVIVFLALVIAACSDNDTSSEESANSSDTTVTGSNEATVSFSNTSLNAGEILELSYDLGPQASQLSRAKDGATGTIRWGDNTQTRVRGSGTARHRYNSTGTFSVSVQIDGQESIRMGSVIVQAASNQASTLPQSSTLPAAPTSPTAVTATNLFAGTTCSPSSFDIVTRTADPALNLTFPSPFADGSTATLTVDRTDSSTGTCTFGNLTFSDVNINPGGLSRGFPSAFGCAGGPTDTITVTYTHVASSSTATCRWSIDP